MVLVRISGGLGNQMFQYALGRHLSLKMNCPLLADRSFFHDSRKNTAKRTYDLDPFALPMSFADEDTLRIFRFNTLQKIRCSLGLSNRYVLTEKSFTFDPEILKTDKSCYLRGHWQSEKYFKDVEGIIRNDFSFRNEVHESLKPSACRIESSNSIALHIRRGDNVSVPSSIRLHGICSMEYYQNALKLMSERVEDPVIFVFSDDLEWAKSHLNLPLPTQFVQKSDSCPDVEEMRLMSMCKHHIIANSTFSWWGAWLGSSPDKIVIAPQKWFNLLQADTSDLIPSSWIRL